MQSMTHREYLNKILKGEIKAGETYEVKVWVTHHNRWISVILGPTPPKPRKLPSSAVEDYGMDRINRMSGKTFEEYLEVLFEKLGFTVERTRYRGDYGADLVAYKDGVKTVIQAKRSKGNVGVKAIQEAAAAKRYYQAAKAIVVTNSSFTTQAMRLAKANEVELWGYLRLITAINTARM